jgi:hypothetical protein
MDTLLMVFPARKHVFHLDAAEDLILVLDSQAPFVRIPVSPLLALDSLPVTMPTLAWQLRGVPEMKPVGKLTSGWYI